ncbi:LGFP repeat-containing protein [Deinococcus knuensis]|uniref:Uncharacterized protein n=1 Tax=Deinococcus knuensis TaxID=1837380 RepID=A0ABQ2SVK9_9DEIO|nr:hypothetical protein [Deinococcus knuensis]GGS39528.1 hypothetical protein GCM10008961_33680 [Deinococcus knuensis]
MPTVPQPDDLQPGDLQPGAAPPGDDPQRCVTHTTRLTVTDDETFGPGEHARLIRRGTVILGPQQPTLTDLTTGRCGGDTRVDVRVTYAHAPRRAVAVSVQVRLFEAHHPDRPAPAAEVSVSGRVPDGQTRTLTARVRAACLSVTVSNLSLNPTDPAGTLEAKAQALGAAFTGAPTGPCEAVRGGHRRRYERCDLYFSPATGAHEVHGDIRRKYDARGGPDSDLALPVTDQTPTQDGQGHFNHFQGNGSVYWHPRTGPMVIGGPTRALWAASGWERGPYGYPTSDPLGSDAPASGPGERFSDFQNGVLFLAGGAPLTPATATLNAGRLVRAFERALRRRAGAQRMQITAVTCTGVSDTAPDFSRSGNRTVTFRVTGEQRSGDWAIPEPTFELTVPVQFAATPPPDARRAVTLIARQAGVIGLHTAPHPDAPHAGAAHPDPEGHVRALHDLTDLFRAPVRLAVIPAQAGLLSVKVLPGGDLRLYFRPDERGRAAATLARRTLDQLDFWPAPP